MIELTGVALLHPRGGGPLVSDATLAVERGQVVLVVAAAGLGSSRLMAAMLGEADCAAGRISMLGRDVGKLRRASLRQLRRRVGIVPQELYLLEDRSAQLNAVMPLEIDGVPRSASIARAVAVLEQLGLADASALPVEVLSRSARQRVAVARALVRQPEILLADHPTSDQDAVGAQLVCRALDQAAAGGAACVVFSRDPMLRIHAEAQGWGQWLLADGQLRPLHEGAGEALDELEIAMEQVPRARPLRGGIAPGAPLAAGAPAPASALDLASPPPFAAAIEPFTAAADPFVDPAADPFANVLPFPGTARAGAR